MPRSRSPATAVVVPFPKAAKRPLTFTWAERQALLALTYAVPGTGMDVACGGGKEYVSLGAADFEGGAWWTVYRTAAGFDVVNARGFRVGRFDGIGPLVERLRPAMAYMLGLLQPEGDAQAADSV